jgi:hypothetical protein
VSPMPRAAGRIAALVALVVALALAAPAAEAARPPAPRGVGPAAGATVAAAPALSWTPVRRAAQYEYQLAADSSFSSVVGGGQAFTQNTDASIVKTLADGRYFWRARGINAKGQAGHWSAVRAFTKRWTARPIPLAPVDGAAVSYPSTPIVLSWSGVPHAYKYAVAVATDPGMAHSALGARLQSVVTSGTSLALSIALAPGRYYWSVTPLDADLHPGTRSGIASFDRTWPTATAARVADLDASPAVFDPQFSWDPVPGAAAYQVEVSPSDDFAVGSKTCCDDSVSGTALSPRDLLPNNRYSWRVRAIDLDGNAGAWNEGPPFEKAFDHVTPTVPRLRLRDNLADTTPATLSSDGAPSTGAPVVAWDPVPGASSYSLTVAPWDPAGFCDWTSTIPRAKSFLTATTAWTPLASHSVGTPVGSAFGSGASDGAWSLSAGRSYCVRVRARTDRDGFGKEILSDWTQLGGSGRPAFTYTPPVQTCAAGTMPAGAYRGPTSGATLGRMPLFSWSAVPNACGYYVVVARDPSFTKVVDVALTNVPAYAPRTALGVTTYADETTSYYWAVMPTRDADGGGLMSASPEEDFPQSFQKRSAPPTLLSPVGGVDSARQPVFRWVRVDGARDYRIQVDDDPTFGSPLADVVTHSTSYVSSDALPADSVLYWRVRADDENRIGLTWSATQTFRRRLPVPAIAANPTGGEGIPVLSWAPVEGAVSYDMHVEQADGTKRDFTMRSTAFTPVTFYGTGVWHWQVRAAFRSGVRSVSGGYTSQQPFTRRIALPRAAKAVRSNRGILLSWSPTTMAHRYRVQIAATDSFSRVLETGTTTNTAWAPRMINPAFAAGGPLYWRVATVDEGNNLGGWTTAPLRRGKTLRLRLRGALRAGHRGHLRVIVTPASGKPLGRAFVTVRGAGVMLRPRHTDTRGRVILRMSPRIKGRVTVVAERRGYTPATRTVRVR